eukprot:comp20437_c0_seq1/m.41089 comp20437_c0_seq1/g.41089  ORF comp20437_c0_seq1/g.41089 comp20437_c0_seq1/m.41089 type:complete len:228 (+) comp20437_c0_seq1:244-927(+)
MSVSGSVVDLDAIVKRALASAAPGASAGHKDPVVVVDKAKLPESLVLQKRFNIALASTSKDASEIGRTFQGKIYRDIGAYDRQKLCFRFALMADGTCVAGIDGEQGVGQTWLLLNLESKGTWSLESPMPVKTPGNTRLSLSLLGFSGSVGQMRAPSDTPGKQQELESDYEEVAVTCGPREHVFIAVGEIGARYKPEAYVSGKDELDDDLERDIQSFIRKAQTDVEAL